MGREAHGQFLLKDLVNIDVEVFVGEVEFEEIRCCLFDQRFIVVVPYRQAPGAFKGEVAAGYEVVLQIALKKERPFFNVALDGTPEQLRQVVRLQAAAGRLDGHIRLGDYLTFGYVAGRNQRFGQVHAVHQFTGGNFTGRGRADGFLNVTNLPHHRRELFGQQRYSVIVAFQGFIGREMLLDNLRTARNSGHGHMVAAFMPGIADQALADLGEAVHIR